MVSTAREANFEPSSAEAAALAKSIHNIVRSLLHQIQPSVEDEGISKGQFFAMHVLTNMSAASLSTVAKRLAITAPSACVTIDSLEAAGLVRKHRSARDHRTVEVSLTPKGRRVEARVWDRIGRRIADAAGDLPPEDLATSVRVFHELDRRLDQTLKIRRGED